MSLANKLNDITGSFEDLSTRHFSPDETFTAHKNLHTYLLNCDANTKFNFTYKICKIKDMREYKIAAGKFSNPQ